MYIANQLVEEYGKDNKVCWTLCNFEQPHIPLLAYAYFKVKKLLKKVEFIFVPVVNPDGYEVCCSYLYSTHK